MSSVVIVGSGVSGAVLARELLEASDDTHVTILEAGPPFETRNHRVWLDRLMAGVNLYDAFWDDPREENDYIGLRGSRLFVKGGTTNHWGGWSLRFKPEDFELASRTGLGADWPIGYRDLAPYYTRAEFLLGIEGDSDNDDPPRYGDRFPFPAADFTANDAPVIEALEGLGMSYSHMPMARNADKCVTTGTCRYCPVDARYTATHDLALLQSAFEDRLEIRCDSPATEVLMDGKRRSRGVRTVNPQSGVPNEIEADVVAVCCGTFESTKLLLASTSSDWSEGIGNDSGHLGRHLVGHPLLFAEGVGPGNPDKLAQELGFITLASRHFDTPEYQRMGKMLFARVGDDANTNLERAILNNVSRAEIESNMASGMLIGLETSFEQFESPANRVGLGTSTDKWGLRGTDITFEPNELTETAYREHTENLVQVLKAAGCKQDAIRVERIKPDGAHATSTCRMSGSDADGVVDADLRVHGTENVYVCSNAVFPNVTGVNPTLTLAALAARLASHLGGSQEEV